MADEEIKRLREEADKALRRVAARRSLSERLAEGWREARRDNNFREIIRRLPPVAGEGR